MNETNLVQDTEFSSRGPKELAGDNQIKWRQGLGLAKLEMRAMSAANWGDLRYLR